MGGVNKSFQKTSLKTFYPFIVNKPSQRNEQLKILVFLEMKLVIVIWLWVMHRTIPRTAPCVLHCSKNLFPI